MPSYTAYVYNEYYLMHHGIRGMHWGVRRYQEKDGDRTALGLKHLRETRHAKQAQRKINKLNKKIDPNSDSFSNRAKRGKVARLESARDLHMANAKLKNAKAIYKKNKTADNKKAIYEAKINKISAKENKAKANKDFSRRALIKDTLSRTKAKAKDILKDPTTRAIAEFGASIALSNAGAYLGSHKLAIAKGVGKASIKGVKGVSKATSIGVKTGAKMITGGARIAKASGKVAKVGVKIATKKR